MGIMAKETFETQVDSRYRVVLGKRIRRESGIKKGERLVAVPFRGGVVLQAVRGRFTGSLAGFNFVEEEHEADAFVKRTVRKDSGA
jgi:bifunctional DNA-binding transcriptional regulator/antitoxin component of YhaV-PrlF toxin-antitoxin module